MKKYNICFNVAIILILTLLFILSLGYPFRAKILPMIIIVLAIIISVIEIIKDILARRREFSIKDVAQQMNSASEIKPLQMKFSMVLVWLFGLPLTIWLLGFLIALPLYVLVYIKLNGEKWRWAIASSVVMFVVIYVGFGLMLSMPLDAGFLFQIKSIN